MTGSTVVCLPSPEGVEDPLTVLIGATPEGKKELLGFQAGFRESARSWRRT